MNVDRAELEKACFELTRSIRWKDNQLDLIIANAMVQGYVKIALEHEEYLAGQERDPNLVVRAVRYLAHVHAIPPLEGNMEWFRSVLCVLIELACPNTSVDEDQEAFFQDLLQGIEEARRNYA